MGEPSSEERENAHMSKQVCKKNQDSERRDMFFERRVVLVLCKHNNELRKHHRCFRRKYASQITNIQAHNNAQHRNEPQRPNWLARAIDSVFQLVIGPYQFMETLEVNRRVDIRRLPTVTFTGESEEVSFERCYFLEKQFITNVAVFDLLH